MNDRRRYDEWDRFSAVGCCAVVLLHVLSLAVTSLRPESWQLALAWFVWQSAAYAMPGFLFVSALKVGDLLSAGDFSVKRFLAGRAKRILLPYLIANLLYYAAFLAMGWLPRETVGTFFGHLLLGDLSSQFYYVVIVFQYWLLIPLWRTLLRRVPWPAALLTALFVTLLFYRFGDVLSSLGVMFQYTDRIFPTYLVFWTAGLYTGSKYPRVRETLLQRSGWTIPCGILWLGFSALSWGQHVSGRWLYDLNVLKLASDGGAILLLLRLCLRLSETRRPRVCRALERIHGASWFVYLSHCLPLTLGTVALQGLGVRRIGLLLLGRLFFAGVLPFLLWEGWHCIRRRLTPDTAKGGEAGLPRR